MEFSAPYKLTADNYIQGFLIDSEWMAGIAEDPIKAGTFLAFVVAHETGETIASTQYPTLGEALSALNKIPRAWTYERSGGCGGCADGTCGKSQCAIKQDHWVQSQQECDSAR